MTILERRQLGTDPVRGWMYYDLHFASTYVFGEALLGGNYRSCIERAESVQAGGLGAWARKMKAEGYHELYVHAFIGMWAAFETAIENMVAAFLLNDESSARMAHGRLGKSRQSRYPLDSWPWSREACLSISKTLQDEPKEKTPDGGVDLRGRLKTLFGWLDVHLEDNRAVASDLAEANQVRNILMHRYGEVSETDANAIPTLRPWIGKVMPMNQERFWKYQKAISETIISAMTAVSKSRHHPPEIAG